MAAASSSARRCRHADPNVDVVDQAGLEGIVTKRADSKYRSGRTRDWLKIKSFEEAEFDLVGVRRERGKPAMALLARPARWQCLHHAAQRNSRAALATCQTSR